jgi:hypothetical protein
MSKKRDVNIVVPQPQLETQSPPLEQMDPAMFTPVPQVQIPEPPVEKRNGRDVIPWEGPAVAHACPKCGCRLLADRLTKACVVTTTRKVEGAPGGQYQDRDMKCLYCGIMFLAREPMKSP